MRKIILIICCLFISGCSMVSKELLPGITLRENPKVKLIEYDNYALLNWDCLRQHKVPGVYSGCAWVPLNPAEECTIRVMRGDSETLEHETAHCHGYADTFLPWEAK